MFVDCLRNSVGYGLRVFSYVLNWLDVACIDLLWTVLVFLG